MKIQKAVEPDEIPIEALRLPLCKAGISLFTKMMSQKKVRCMGKIYGGLFLRTIGDTQDFGN